MRESELILLFLLLRKKNKKVLNGEGNMAADPKALNVDMQYVTHLHQVTE